MIAPPVFAPEQTALEARLVGYGTLLQLQARARRAKSVEELSFVVVNETHGFVPYRQAMLWRRESASGRVIAMSGIPNVDPQAPFILWLERALAALDKVVAEKIAPTPVNDELLPVDLRGEWDEWLPAHGLWMPLVAPGGASLGVLFLLRDAPWEEGELIILTELGEAYAHAWLALAGDRQTHAWRNFAHGLRPKLAAAVLLGAVLCVPVTQSVLAPAEISPFDPTIVRAPIEGVIDHFQVEPNQEVKAGDLLLKLDPTMAQNKLDVARKALETAQTEYQQASQQALVDDKARLALAEIKGRVEEAGADVAYAETLLGRTQVKADRAGIAIFDDPDEAAGRPVSIGERLLTVADPKKAEIEIWLPVADAVQLKPGAEVRMFLNVAPETPVAATLRYAAYEPTMSPDGVLAYRMKARLLDGEVPPRIGLKGTAKIYGPKVSLFYYLARRPLAAVRQFLGL